MAQLGRKAKQRRFHAILLGTVILIIVFVIIFGTFYYQSSRPKPLNPLTLCPESGPLGHYVLLVDKTDPLTFTQDKAFKVTLLDLVENRIPEGYLFSVFVLGEDFKATAEPLAELCNPGSDNGRSELTDNLSRRKRQYKEKFVDPLITQSESLVSTTAVKISPIFEMLQLVGVNAFRKHNIKGVRRLVIMSDMLHNTNQYSMYKGTVDYPVFAETDYAKRTQLDLQGVEVEIYYLMNSPKLQTKRNLAFWEAYFSKAGGRIVSVRPLEG